MLYPIELRARTDRGLHAGGEERIRTSGPVLPDQPLSRRLPSATRPPLQAHLAEGVGFEPTELSLSGFQDRRLKPLGHPSARGPSVLGRDTIAAPVSGRQPRAGVTGPWRRGASPAGSGYCHRRAGLTARRLPRPAPRAPRRRPGARARSGSASAARRSRPPRISRAVWVREGRELGAPARRSGRDVAQSCQALYCRPA